MISLQDQKMIDKYIIKFCIFLDKLVAPIDRIFEDKKKKCQCVAQPTKKISWWRRIFFWARQLWSIVG